jgi:hypothetical protein
MSDCMESAEEDEEDYIIEDEDVSFKNEWRKIKSILF